MTLATIFPHTFFTLKGKVDSTGEEVDTNYGFTAVSVSPAILLGSVKGMIETKEAKYVEKSNRHFSLKLSDDQYALLIAHVGKWRTLSGKSYNLGKQNCVHFVMEAIVLSGVSGEPREQILQKAQVLCARSDATEPDAGIVRKITLRNEKGRSEPRPFQI